MRAKILYAIIIITIGTTMIYGAWDITKPADSDGIYTWPTSIRAMWDALEVVFGTDLSSANPIGEGVSFWSSTSFAAAITAIGATETTLIVDTSENISANVTVPANVTLFFSHEGELDVDLGQTVTINCEVQAGLYQIFVGDGTIDGTFSWQTEVLPEWWGANISGTASDSAPAIQKAIDFCEARVHGTVLFQDGVYYWCNSALTIQANMVGLRGGSRRISIIRKNFEGGVLLEMGQTGSQVENNFIRDLRFDVDGSVTAKGVGLKLTNAGTLTVTDFQSIGFEFNLRIHDDSTTLYFTRCMFSDATSHGVWVPYNGDGAAYILFAVYFLDCKFRANTGAGFMGNNCADLHFSFCQINDNGAHGISLNGQHTGVTLSDNPHITHCEVDSNGNYGIIVNKAQFFHINHNTSSNRGATVDGILVDNSEEGEISGNLSINNGRHGITVYRSSHIQVTGNNCTDNAATAVANAAGIIIDSSDYITLTGNECSKKGDLGAQGQEYGILTQGACTYLTVTGNSAHGNDTTNFYNNATAVTTHRVDGNNFGDSNSLTSSTNVLTLTDGGKFFIVTSTEDITSMTASYNDRIATLKFSDTKAANGVVDGGNLKLTGDFAFTPDDVLSLVCDGTNWYEISRSAN